MYTCMSGRDWMLVVVVWVFGFIKREGEGYLTNVEGKWASKKVHCLECLSSASMKTWRVE